jgi:hypothetical protein
MSASERVTADQLESRWVGAEERVPESMDEFHGPTSGTVALPGWLAWSGMTEFEVQDREDRVHMYQILMDVGQRRDAASYMDAGLLRQDWALLRRLIPRELRRIWEARLSLGAAA